MPKDTTAAPRPTMPSFSEILADLDVEDHDTVELSELPPLTAAEEIKRTPRTQPIPDLSTFAKLWQFHGGGNTGKTFVARYLIAKLIDQGKLGQNIIAALAPGNRNLTAFAPGTMQPPTSDPVATAEWATKRLLAMQKARYGGVWDFGGGDNSHRRMIEATPDMVDRAEQEGLAIVAAYTFGPRADDLIFLKTFERMGFRPRATLLILNLGLVDSPSASTVSGGSRNTGRRSTGGLSRFGCPRWRRRSRWRLSGPGFCSVRHATAKPRKGGSRLRSR